MGVERIRILLGKGFRIHLHSRAVLKCQAHPHPTPTEMQGKEAIAAQQGDSREGRAAGGTNESRVRDGNSRCKARIRMPDLEITPMTGSDTGTWKFFISR